MWGSPLLTRPARPPIIAEMFEMRPSGSGRPRQPALVGALIGALLVTLPAAAREPTTTVRQSTTPSALAEPERQPEQGLLPPDVPVPADTLGVATPIEDASGRALHRFYESLRETERGQRTTRILVWGASHVAGDGFTRLIRHRLQARFGDSGPGFVVSAKPWRDYNHRDVNIDYSRGWSPYWVSSRHSRDDGLYGIAGCSFASDDKRDFCKIETARVSEFGRNVTDIELYFWKQPKGGDLLVSIDGAKPKRISTRSAEPGPGYAHFEVPDGRHTIELRPRGNGQVLLFGASLERDRPGVLMDQLGINGARASSQLEWDPRVFADHLTRRKPDLVVLAYGTNAIGDDDDPLDAYEKRLDHVINRVRSLVPQASCLYIGPSDRPVKVETPGLDGEVVTTYHRRPRQAQVIEVQRRVAQRYGCGYWDWVAAMGGDLSMVQWVGSEPRLGAGDYVHFTRAGYERLADIFWNALMAGYSPGR